jgi:hypothetical protein
MNLIKLSLITAFFSVVAFSVKAQNVKLKYKKIILVTYRSSGKGSREFIRIESYKEINANGVVHDVYNVFDNYYGDLTFKGYMGDTTYKVPDSLVSILNSLFNGRKKLKEHSLNNKTSTIKHFAGPFEFLNYSTENHDDNLVIVTQEFLDQELNDVLDKLFRLPFTGIHIQGKVYRNKALEAKILSYHKACKCAPVIEEPPTVMELEAPVPSVKH